MWVQQKMVTPSSPDPRMQSQNQMMLYMMPLMFAFFTISLPSGLSLYWVVSNLISVGIQYYVTGWGGLAGTFKRPVPPPEDKSKRRIALEAHPPSPEEPTVKKTAADADITGVEGLPGQDSIGKRLRRLFGPSNKYQPPK
jgi:hypothetical protein